MPRTTRRYRGGYVNLPAAPAPLSSMNTYTSWPGGVDPTAKLYQASSAYSGGGRCRGRASRKGRSRSSRKSRSSRR